MNSIRVVLFAALVGGLLPIATLVLLDRVESKAVTLSEGGETVLVALWFLVSLPGLPFAGRGVLTLVVLSMAWSLVGVLLARLVLRRHCLPPMTPSTAREEDEGSGANADPDPEKKQ